MLLYFITFTPKCSAAFALAIAAINAELRAVLQNEICRILQFQQLPILRAQNWRMLTSILNTVCP